MGQVLANLLENAERLSPDDSVIRISARAVAGDRGTASSRSPWPTRVPGSPARSRERVFEMFSQNSGGARAGLGLAIAKAFVEAHGGSIWVEPDATTGARGLHRARSSERVPACRSERVT